ncbi:hypothetical protein [Crocosphaera chwakensis]|uniref:hypothetical protein n=1 Tax=Crocosphaera chwakensis TaxID=2546361 RepID=UPI00056B7782|nr:hypothetical protein [Crocosphaera chwakensis]
MSTDQWKKRHDTPNHEKVREVKFRYKGDHNCNNLQPSYRPALRPNNEKELTPNNLPLPVPNPQPTSPQIPRIPW